MLSDLFGVFVGLAAGIDGLVHLSDLSWNETGEAAVRNFKKGQEVEALVLAIDVDDHGCDFVAFFQQAASVFHAIA